MVHRTEAIGKSRRAATSRVEFAYNEIKKRILDNVYPPGFQAMEQEVAEELGVSRTPVREALIRLEQDGLVNLVPRRGMRVVPLVPSDMREIYEVLNAAECMAVVLIARAPDREERLAPIEAVMDEMEAALVDDDLERWADADERYHRLLMERCGNKRLAGIAATVRDQGHRARMVTLKLRPKPEGSNREHREVLAAMQAGDWERARESHFRHRLRTSAVLTELIESYGLAQL